MLENRKSSFTAAYCLFVVLVLTLTLVVAARPPFTPPTDPGVRGGPPGAGGPLPGLTTKEAKFFDKGLDEFQEIQSVIGSKVGSVDAASINRGRGLFTSAAVGCYLCHTESLPTAKIYSSALSEKAANLFSDLLVHRMGTVLADDIRQGAAAGDEFRTAPLWGLGQRIFFLHDGRTTDLLEAIGAHSSAGSEASGSVTAFNGLTADQKQDILNFLRSL